MLLFWTKRHSLRYIFADPKAAKIRLKLMKTGGSSSVVHWFTSSELTSEYFFKHFFLAPKILLDTSLIYFWVHFWGTLLGNPSSLNLAADLGPVLALFLNSNNVVNCGNIFNWVIAGLFFIYFWSFSNKHSNFYNNTMWKLPVRCWDLNTQPRERESSPITTRPGLYSFPASFLFFRLVNKDDSK